MQSEVDFDLRHVDAVGTLGNPAILAATLISTCLLVLALTKASQAWQRLNAWNPARRILLVLFGCGSYILVGLMQIMLGETLYRVYAGCGSSVSLGVYVPVVPVWVVGTTTVVAFHVIRNWQKSRAVHQ